MKKLLLPALALALLLSGCAPGSAETPPPTAGETPIPETPAPAASPAPAGPVWTDWSQLDPYEKPVAKYTRRSPVFTDTLTPSDDYGPLLPFPGTALSVDSDWFGHWEEHLYGLATLEGEIIVDPVFTTAYELSSWDLETNQRFRLGCLLLTKLFPGENGEPEARSALSSLDGSWCTPFDYYYDYELYSCVHQGEPLLPMRKGNATLVFLDPATGEEARVLDVHPFLDALGMEEADAWDLLWRFTTGERYAALRRISIGDGLCHILDSETGSVLTLDPDRVGDLESFSEGLCPFSRETEAGPRWGYLDGEGREVIPPRYREVAEFQNGRARACLWDRTCVLIDREGRELYTFPTGTDLWSISFLGDGYIRYRDGEGIDRFLDADLTPVSLPEDFTNPTRLSDGWYYQLSFDPTAPRDPDGPQRAASFWNERTGVRWDFPAPMQLNSFSVLDGKVLLCAYQDEWSYLLADLNTGETLDPGQWDYVSLDQDGPNGELCLSCSNANREEWRDINGDILYAKSGPPYQTYFFHGLVFTAGDQASTLSTLDGKLIFSYPIFSALD